MPCRTLRARQRVHVSLGRAGRLTRIIEYELIKLVSSADTGFYYVTKKNPRNTTEKMSFRKYDPVLRKHVDFKEAKIK